LAARVPFKLQNIRKQKSTIILLPRINDRSDDMTDPLP
jgi:hypothetical protein